MIEKKVINEMFPEKKYLLTKEMIDKLEKVGHSREFLEFLLRSDEYYYVPAKDSFISKIQNF